MIIEISFQMNFELELGDELNIDSINKIEMLFYFQFHLVIFFNKFMVKIFI
jgi:hypothetical protein